MANNKIKTKRSNHRLQKMRYSTCTLITESFIYIRLRISHVMFECIFEYWIKSVSPNSHCTGALALDYPMNDKSTLVIFCLLFLARLFQWLIVLKDAKICKSSYNKAFFLVEICPRPIQLQTALYVFRSFMTVWRQKTFRKLSGQSHGMLDSLLQLTRIPSRQYALLSEVVSTVCCTGFSL